MGIKLLFHVKIADCIKFSFGRLQNGTVFFFDILIELVVDLLVDYTCLSVAYTHEFRLETTNCMKFWRMPR